MRFRRFLAALIGVAAILPAGAAPALADAPTVTLDVSAATVAVGEELTIAPVISEIADADWHCEIGFVGGAYSMRVLAGPANGCHPWTFVVPPAPEGTYTASVMVIVDGYDGTHATASDTKGVKLVAGDPQPYHTNYPVPSWHRILSDDTPRFGVPLTMGGQGYLDGSCYFQLTGQENLFTGTTSDCTPWELTLPTLSGGFGAGSKTWDAIAIISGMAQGMTTGATRPVRFAPAASPQAFASNLPAVLFDADTRAVSPVGAEEVLRPKVIGFSEGTCEYKYTVKMAWQPSVTRVMSGGVCPSAGFVPGVSAGRRELFNVTVSDGERSATAAGAVVVQAPPPDPGTGGAGEDADTTPPSIGRPVVGSGDVIVAGTGTVTFTASDEGSGVKRCEYWIERDPGVGNATPMTYLSNVCSAPLAGLDPGIYTIGVRAKDGDGNWTPTKTLEFFVVAPVKSFATGDGAIVPHVGSDRLPDIDDVTRANYGFEFKYVKGGRSLLPKANLTLHYKDFHLYGRDADWLVVSTNVAVYEGTATVNDVVYPIRVRVVDNDHELDRFTLLVYEPGSRHTAENIRWQVSGETAAAGAGIEGHRRGEECPRRDRSQARQPEALGVFTS